MAITLSQLHQAHARNAAHYLDVPVESLEGLDNAAITAMMDVEKRRRGEPTSEDVGRAAITRFRQVHEEWARDLREAEAERVRLAALERLIDLDQDGDLPL